MTGALTFSSAFAPLVSTLGVVVAAVLVARSASKDLAVKRQLESTERFLELIAVAHGRPRDGRERVGISEQVAAVHLVAEFGAEHSWLRGAATESLVSFPTWLPEGNVVLYQAVEAGLRRLDAKPSPADSTPTGPADSA